MLIFLKKKCTFHQFLLIFHFFHFFYLKDKEPPSLPLVIHFCQPLTICGQYQLSKWDYGGTNMLQCPPEPTPKQLPSVSLSEISRQSCQICHDTKCGADPSWKFFAYVTTSVLNDAMRQFHVEQQCDSGIKLFERYAEKRRHKRFFETDMLRRLTRKR